LDTPERIAADHRLFQQCRVGTALGQANTVTPRLASATEQPSPWPKSRGFLSEQMKSPA
jgi:hypothetical protein